MTEIRVPDIGDFTDVPVIEVHVSAGDEVAIEDPLVTLESDKATMDVPSPAAGVVRQMRVAVGDRVSEGSVLLMLEESLEESVEQASTDARPAEPAPVGEQHAPARADELPSHAPSAAGTPIAGPAGAGRDFDVVVIGAGPGGYTAAFRAADLGLRTALIEREQTLGGVCLNVGCIPSKALLHAARVIADAADMSSHGVRFAPPAIHLGRLLEWKAEVVGKLTGGLEQLARQRKVEVIHGDARLTGTSSLTAGGRTVTFANCIIAVGSAPATLSVMPDDPRVIDSTGALSPSSIPKRLLVVGGGVIGMEMATVYDALGSRVTVVELLDQLIPGCDPDLVRPLHRRVADRYEAILLGTSVTGVKPQRNGLKVEFSQGEAKLFDQILVAVGRRPNGHAVGAQDAGVSVDASGFIAVDGQLRTSVPGIFAIGDVVGGPMLAHKASHEGKTAAEVIAGVPGAEFDPRAIPSVAYTDPEVAWMGLTETAARCESIPYEKATFPWSASGRALTLARAEGTTKLLFDPDSRRLLGAGIVGVGAGELISETVHAIEMGSNAQDIGLTIHPHPTLSETIAFGAELAEGTITDLLVPRRR